VALLQREKRRIINARKIFDIKGTVFFSLEKKTLVAYANVDHISSFCGAYPFYWFQSIGSNNLSTFLNL